MSAALFRPETTAVVLNPVSGAPAARRKARAMAKRLAALGYRVLPTARPNDAGRLALEAVTAGCNSVVAFGGDGTLYETVEHLPPHVALGLFPTGTVNLFARGLDIPREPEAWLALLQSGATIPYSFGLCNGRPFACVASTGFDALVVAQVNRTLKKWIQQGAYAVEALRAFAGYRPPEFRVTLDGTPYRFEAETAEAGRPGSGRSPQSARSPRSARSSGSRSANRSSGAGRLLGIIVGRIPYYGGAHPVLPHAQPRRSELAVAFLHARDKWSLLRFARGMVLGTLPRMKGVVFRTAQRLTIESDPPCPVELDGDPFAQTPVEFTLESAPRTILAPIVVKPPGGTAADPA
ncbi:MAG: diacylglycerol/lipid kinase family protein [Planctomycetota bacterium]